jgi:hypothetical protein
MNVAQAAASRMKMPGVPGVAEPPPRESKYAVSKTAILQLNAHLNIHAGRCPRILRLCRYAAIRSSKEPRLTSFISRNGEKNLNKTCNTSVLAN